MNERDNPFKKHFEGKAKGEQREVTQKDIEKLLKMPYIECKYSKSKDGKFLIHKTIITDIKPITYMAKVIE